MQMLTVCAPAKLNLVLEVCGQLPGGYHALDMLMQAVTLYETVTLQKRPAGLTLCCRAADGALAPDVPTDARNLAYRAAQAFFDAVGLPGGADITVTKAVPSQAGMAGGSADAAGVLFGLDKLYGTALPPAQLLALAAGLGSDVPFCLVGGTARVQGRGERVTPLPPLADCLLVAAMPATGSSTPAGFARYDALGSPLHPDVDAAVRALAEGPARLAPLCANALQAACATAETEDILQTLRAHGAAAALLTGTGAVTYGLFPFDGAAAATAAAATAAANALRCRYASVFVLHPEPRGPFVARYA